MKFKKKDFNDIELSGVNEVPGDCYRVCERWR